MKSKSIILILTVLFLSPKLFGQSYDLNWKLEKNDTLIYNTIMNDLEDPLLIDSIINKIKQNNSNEVEIRQIEKQINDIINIKNDFDFYSQLVNFQDSLLSIKLYSILKNNDEIDSSDKDLNIEKFKQYNQRIMLRGLINKFGNIHSFWMKNNQKNLLSLLFELPSTKIKVGDKWSQNVNLIEIDENFICESSNKNNVVSFVKIKKVEDEIIAVLNYDIQEFVSGFYHIENSKILYGKEIEDRKIMMNLGFNGYAEFSITKGRWLKFEGFMITESSGVSNLKKITNIRLIKE